MFLDVFKVQYCGTIDQDVLHIDERKVMVRSKGMFDKPSPTTEGVVTDVQKRCVVEFLKQNLIFIFLKEV